jgi:hypothetical protein
MEGGLKMVSPLNRTEQNANDRHCNQSHPCIPPTLEELLRSYAANPICNGNTPARPSTTGCSVGEIRWCTIALVSPNSRLRTSTARITLNSNTAVRFTLHCVDLLLIRKRRTTKERATHPTCTPNNSSARPRKSATRSIHWGGPQRAGPHLVTLAPAATARAGTRVRQCPRRLGWCLGRGRR